MDFRLDDFWLGLEDQTVSLGHHDIVLGLGVRGVDLLEKVSEARLLHLVGLGGGGWSLFCGLGSHSGTFAANFGRLALGELALGRGQILGPCAV